MPLFPRRRARLVAIACTKFVHEQAARTDLTPEQHQAIDRLIDNQDGVFDRFVAVALHTLPEQADGLAAIEAPELMHPGAGDHPFFHWLFQGGGLSWLLSIARLFIPSIPPIPNPPPLSAASSACNTSGACSGPRTARMRMGVSVDSLKEAVKEATAAWLDSQKAKIMSPIVRKAIDMAEAVILDAEDSLAAFVAAELSKAGIILSAA